MPIFTNLSGTTSNTFSLGKNNTVTIRNNNGAMEYQNDGGPWIPMGDATDLDGTPAATIIAAIESAEPITFTNLDDDGTATKNTMYLFDGAQNLTLTAPASPSHGDKFGFCDWDGSAETRTFKIGRNDKPIQNDGLNDYGVDIRFMSGWFVFNSVKDSWGLTGVLV